MAEQAPPTGEPLQAEWVGATAPSDPGSQWYGESDGATLIWDGPFRGIDRRGAIDVAPDVLAADACYAFRFRDHWYFVTYEGNVFRAEPFLGRPDDAGFVVGKGVLAALVTRDLALLMNGDHQLWAVTGQSAISLHPPAGVVSHMEEGPDGKPMVEVGGRLFSVTTDGTFVPAPPRRAREPSPPRAEVDSQHYAALHSRLLAAVHARRVTSTAALDALRDLVVLGNGAWVRASQLLTRGHEKCEALRGAVEPLIYCPPADPGEREDPAPGTVFRVSADGHAERWMDVPSSDLPEAGRGPSLLAHGYLRDVWIHDGKEQQVPRVAPEIGDRVLGLTGHCAIALHSLPTSPGTNEARSFVQIDLTSQDEFDHLKERAIADELPAGARIEDAGLSADQSARWVLFRDRTGRPSVALGAAMGSFRLLDLPHETKAIAFVDGLRGVATGSHLGQVWSTTDGALHWSTVKFPMIRGSPDAIPLTVTPVAAPPRCTLVACSGDKFAWASPKALQQVGYEPIVLVAPNRAP